MEFIAASSALVGAWANRCNVFILVPLSGGVIALAALFGAAHGEHWGSVAVGAAVAAASLEAGYVARLIASLLADRLRSYVLLPMPPEGQPPQREPVLLPSVEGPVQSAAGGRQR